MGDLTKNLSRHEVACKCGCGFDTFDLETATVLQECCDYFAGEQGKDDVILDVSSGCRCPSYNSKVGGGNNSQHLRGRAVDFTIRGIAPHDVYEYLNLRYPDKYGLGYYVDFTHLDTKSGRKRRW